MGPFTLVDNDVFFSVVMCEQLYDNATYLWRHGYKVKNLCRCRQVRKDPITQFLPL